MGPRGFHALISYRHSRALYARKYFTKPRSSHNHCLCTVLADVNRARRSRVILPVKRRRLRSRDLAQRASLACNTGRAWSGNSQLVLRPIHPAAGRGVEVLSGRCGRPFWRAPAPRGSTPRRCLSAPAEAGAAPPLVERSEMAPPHPGPDASTLSGGGRQKNCPSEERLLGSGRTVVAPALGPPRGCWAGIAASGHGGEGGGWAESSLAAKLARHPFPPPPSTL